MGLLNANQIELLDRSDHLTANEPGGGAPSAPYTDLNAPGVEGFASGEVDELIAVLDEIAPRRPETAQMPDARHDLDALATATAPSSTTQTDPAQIKWRRSVRHENEARRRRSGL
jgi:hypothetical protein